MELLVGAERDYAWGTSDCIPELLGRVPDGTPVAELWLGAHPQGPARLRPAAAQPPAEPHARADVPAGPEDAASTHLPAGGTPLDRLLESAPERYLGHESLAGFGVRLPFLLKVLAVRVPLSIQVHPTRAQAVAGYAAEETAGTDRDSPERSFKDAWHKPELVFALTRFHALSGFRTPAAVHATAERLSGVAERLAPDLQTALSAWKDALAEEAAPLARGLALLLEHRETYGRLADALAEAQVPEMADGHPSRAGSPVDPLVTLREANREFPSDAGALVTLMLRRHLLEPGQALAVEAGELHAYLGGLAVEIMASSDNVLRGGLTSKHIDVPELLRTVDFEASAPEVLSPDAHGELRGRTDDFVLTVVGSAGARADSAAERTLHRAGAQILFCADGEASVGSGGEELRLGRGEAAFLAADEARPHVRTSGLVFAASAAL